MSSLHRSRLSVGHSFFSFMCLALIAAGCGAATGIHSGPAAKAGKADNPGDGAQSATIIVHYPTGYGHRIALRGASPLSWDQGIGLSWTAGDRWTTTLELTDAVEIKPLYDDTTWAVGPNWTLQPGQTLDIWPWFFHDQGSIQRVENWHSNTLDNDRGIWIYLPPSYDENPAERYPVVYMHDGQNLFYDEDSFSQVSWNVGGAMDDGASQGSIHEAIVIGIDSTDNRTWEYTATADPEWGGGGGDQYLAFIVGELKPWVDGGWRTSGDAAHTAIIGSSLGGLISAHAGVRYANVFGLVGSMSPTTWWDNREIVGEVQSIPAQPKRALRVYVDSGDVGAEDGQDCKPDTDLLAQAYLDAGYADEVNFRHVVQQGADHSEYWWRQRIPGALGFLLGGR